MIDFQQKQNWRLVVSSLQRCGYVWMGVAIMKTLNIYFYRVHLAFPFGLWCDLGLILMEWTLRLFQIISPNSYITQVLWKRDDILCSSFSFFVFKFCGMNAIVSFLKIINVLFFQLPEKVKSYSLCWLKAKHVSFVSSTQMWWSNPLMCLDIG